MNGYGFVLICGGALLVGTAALARAGILKRNGIVGIRIPSTYSSDAAWAAGHHKAAPWVAAAGLVWVVAGVVLLLSPVQSSRASSATTVSTVLVLALMGWSAITAHRAAVRARP